MSSAHIFLLSGVSTLRMADSSLMNSVSEIGLSTSSYQHSNGNPNTYLKDVGGKDGVVDSNSNMGLNESGSKVAIASVSDDVMPSESDDVIHDEIDDAVFCSVDAWMAQWQMLAVHRPILVQVLCCLVLYSHQFIPFISSLHHITSHQITNVSSLTFLIFY